MGLSKAGGAAFAALILFAAQPAGARYDAENVPADPTLFADARAVLLVGSTGPHLDATVGRHLEDGGRGVILFSNNIRSKPQVRNVTSAIACSANAPVLIATDQELGPVQRLRRLVTPTPSPAVVVQGTPGDTYSMASRLGQEMIGLGINMNLAPLLDVVRGPNPVLAGRAFPGDAQTVIAHGNAFAAGLRSTGVVATAKHFPGHGLSRSDPHTAVTRITATSQTLATDLAPFRAAVDAGIKAVMVGHPVYEALDPSLPASLSPAVLDLLREDLGFGGVAVTDGLSMRAVRSDRSLSEVAVLALRAGQDLLIVEASSEIDGLVNALAQAVQLGDLDRDRLAEAAQRVRRLAAWAAQPRCPQPRPAVRRS
jgi:beta-N-acetylhexosaminidase